MDRRRRAADAAAGLGHGRLGRIRLERLRHGRAGPGAPAVQRTGAGADRGLCLPEALAHRPAWRGLAPPAARSGAAGAAGQARPADGGRIGDRAGRVLHAAGDGQQLRRGHRGGLCGVGPAVGLRAAAQQCAGGGHVGDGGHEHRRRPLGPGRPDRPPRLLAQLRHLQRRHRGHAGRRHAAASAVRAAGRGGAGPGAAHQPCGAVGLDCAVGDHGPVRDDAGQRRDAGAHADLRRHHVGRAGALRPCAAALAGADAIWWSFPFGSVLSALVAWAWYRRGSWRRNRPMLASLDSQYEEGHLGE